MTTASETGIYPFIEAWVPGSKMGLAVSERPDGGSFYEVLENMLLAALSTVGATTHGLVPHPKPFGCNTFFMQGFLHQTQGV